MEHHVLRWIGSPLEDHPSVSNVSTQSLVGLPTYRTSHGCDVLCHHSPRRIFLTFRQDSLYSRCQPLPICAAPPSVNSGILRFGPRHSFHPLTSGRICFRLSQATHGSHPQLIHIGFHLSSLCIKRGWPNLAVPFISERSHGM